MTDEQVQTLNQVVTDVANKLDKNQGTANAGKILTVGEDGNVVLADVVSELKSQIGNLSDLATTDKSSLVAAINDAAQSGGTSAGGGMSSAASALLIAVLRNAVYSSDQSANITALEAALAAGSSGDSSGDDSGSSSGGDTNTGGSDSGGSDSSGTAITMSETVQHNKLNAVAHYSDAGTTTYSDSRFPTTNGKTRVSENVFDSDTPVKITCTPTANAWQCWLFCCVSNMIDTAIGADTGDPFRWIVSSNDTFAYAWSTVSHTFEYTVRAGYRLCVMGIGVSEMEALIVEVA